MPRLDADWWETGMAFALGYMRGLKGWRIAGKSAVCYTSFRHENNSA